MENQSLNKGSKLKYLDIVKGISILMVMNVHFPNNSSLFVNGVTFHIVAFFMVSGILMHLKNEENLSYEQIILKKIRSIGYPYISLSLFYILFYTVYNFLTNQDSIGLLGNIYFTGSFLGIGTLWFLPTLFFAELFFLFIYKWIRPKTALILISIVAIMSIFTSNYLTNVGLVGEIDGSLKGIFTTNVLIVILRSLIASGFIALGYCLGKIIKHKRLSEMKKSTTITLGLTLFVLNYFISLYSVGNDIHFAKIESPFIYLTGSILGSLAVLLFSFGIENLKFVSNAFSWLGNNSLIIMTTHLEYKIVKFAYYLISNINGISHLESPVIFGLMVFAITISIEIVIVLVIKKSFLINLYKMPKRKTINPLNITL